MIGPAENITSICVVIFGITLFWMIRTVRKRDFEMVKNALTNPLWPRTNLRFFVQVYKKYVTITRSRILVIINLVSLFFVLVGLVYVILDY